MGLSEIADTRPVSVTPVSNEQISKQTSAIQGTLNHPNVTPDSNTRQLTVFISAPGDVAEERQIVRRVVEKLNKDDTIGPQAQIKIVTWDDSDADVPLFAHVTSHTNINEEVLRPSQCDIVVVIFWSQMGNPLPGDIVREDGTSYESQIEWEYEDAINNAKHNDGHPTVLVYRNSQPVTIHLGENPLEKFAQVQRVFHFFSRFGSTDGTLKRRYNVYDNLKEFEQNLEKHLRVVIGKLLTEVPPVRSKQSGQEAQAETSEADDVNELLKPYLNWIIEQHGHLELRGLGGDTRLPTIPLEKVYVALKGSQANTYEREQSQELLRAETSGFLVDLSGEFSVTELVEMLLDAENRAIIDNPYMPSLVERDRPEESVITPGGKVSVVTLGDAFQKERWMVILGDPGSGKTTLARWIALNLASALLDDKPSVIVPAHQVDPKIDKSDTTTIDIGPARLPILLRVSEFAEARHNPETSSIANFLGYHSWLGEFPDLSKQKLNALIKRYLQLGRAVVILDGMDEITDANQRIAVVQSIETFIKDWINAHGKKMSPQEKVLLWHHRKGEEPVKTGGNQIIITSRIVGYQARPITGQVTHVKIQPMEQVAVEHFCDAWTLAVHQLLNPYEKDEGIQEKAKREADGLKAAIFDSRRPRIRELASNPLLITIIALVYRSNRGRLPEQRVELYQEAMKILIEDWRITGMTTREVTEVLSPLASRIHQQSSTGLIAENEMRAIIKEALATFRGDDVSALPPAFMLDVDAFIRRVRENVGLLSERSKGLYGFLHLTFQEYLAALDLVRDKRNAPQAIIDRLDDPRWREPILMALGHISVHPDWGSDTRQQLLTTLLNADDPLGDLIPRSALLIVAAIPEMARVSEDIVREIIRRLLTTYANRGGTGQFSTLRERINSSFKNLSNSNHQQLLEQYLEKTLLDIERGDRNVALASASLIAENKWHSNILLKALIKAFPYDDPEWEYPITRTLMLRQGNLPVAADTLPFRQSLEEEHELVEYIKNDLPWLRVVVLLYGGIFDNGLAGQAVQYDEIVWTLHLEDMLKQSHIDRLRERDYWRESWNNGDVVKNLEAYRDTEGIELSKRAAAYVLNFTPQAIFNDSPLTSIVLNALRQKKSPAMLKNYLWREWRTASHEMCRVHALLALLVIDTQQAIDTLTQSFKNATTSALAKLILNQLLLRKYALADTLILLGRKAEIGSSLDPLPLGNDQWGDVVALFFRTFTSVMPRPIGYDDVLLGAATTIPRINAEIWAYWLSGLAKDDPVYSYAVVLDTLGKKLKSASALINIQFAYNRKYDEFTQWHSLAILPEYDKYTDVVGEVLTVAHQSRSEIMKYLFHVGTMTFVGIDYQDYPELKADALAATLLIPLEFQEEVIRQLDAELLQTSAHELINQIIKRVVLIADPVIRSRALWRVAQYPFYWKNLNFWDLSIKAAEQVVDPLHRSRAFERLINYVPQRQRDRLKDEALKAAKGIRDPNNRARALAQLARYESNAKRWSLLSEALTSVKKIASERQQIDTIQLIYPYLVESQQLKQKCDDIIKNVKSDWYRNKGKNLLSIQLLALHDQLHEPQKLTPVILASLIDEIVMLKPQETSGEDLWSQLLDSAERERAIAALLKTVSANNLEGLYLTPNVFDVIRLLLNAKEISTIHRLLPYLRGVEPSLLPSLNGWVDNPSDKMLWAYAGLLLAEAGQVNPNTIPCLIELIKNGIDFGRYRASIVLHGSRVFVQKKNRDFRSSQLGMEALLLLAQAQKQLLSEKVQIATPIEWVWHNIIHDDPILFQQLIHHSDREESRGGVSSLLRQISYCDAEVLNVIVSQFEEGSEKTQELLLHSWLDLSKDYFRKNITPVQKKRMEEAISKLPDNILESVKVIPDRLYTLSDLLCSMGTRIEEEKITFQQAISVLNQELSALSLRLPGSSIEELTEHTLYNLTYDPQRALNAARTACENGTSLELLFAWLAESLREDIDDFPRLYYRTSTLLELAGATTHFSPAAVYNLLEKNELGQVLVQATMHHRSFWGRAGAATLLGYLRQTPALFDDALLSGLHDVAEVQTAIVQMVQNLRYLDEPMIPKMLSLLAHESASVVYTVSKLLVSIARHEKTPHSLRQKIVKSLNITIKQKNSSHPVFVLEKADARIFIRNIGRLDQQLYSDIISIIGVV